MHVSRSVADLNVFANVTVPKNSVRERGMGCSPDFNKTPFTEWDRPTESELTTINATCMSFGDYLSNSGITNCRNDRLPAVLYTVSTDSRTNITHPRYTKYWDRQ
jgi:hypothetical protein